MSSHDRASRRHVRLRCLVRLDGGDVVGHSSDLSRSGICVQIEKGHIDATLLAVNGPVAISVSLPDETEPVEATGVIRWVHPDDRDIAARPIVSFGAQLDEMTPHAAERLATFVRDFRYAVLIVDDDDEQIAAMTSSLCDEYQVLGVRDTTQAFELLARSEVSVVVATRIEVFKELSGRLPNAPYSRIFVTREPALLGLGELGKDGHFFQMLAHPYELKELKAALSTAISAYALTAENFTLARELERVNERLRRENAFLRQRVKGDDRFEHIIGQSPQLRQALAEVDRIRLSDATVHIEGKTGTGKELVARALHFNGARAKRPFVTQNCGGMTESLLQATLFGHQKGAFTGADRARAGVFQEADGGTLFLDEVAELSPATQSMLLRVLQEHEIHPVGASRPIKVDVRILSATHKDLREEVKQGRFREDLYFRLVVISIRLPSLKERTGDVPLLAQHLLDLYCERYGKVIRGFEAAAMVALDAYEWPGNVRELQNEILRVVLLAEEGRPVPLALLSPHIRLAAPASKPSAGVQGSGAPATDGIFIPWGLPYDEAVTALERQLIARALREGGGAVSKAAELLRMERSRLAKLRRRLGVD